MGLVQPTSESKTISLDLTSVVMPCDKTTVINQGSRVKLSSNKIVVTAADTDDWCGVADFKNPPVLLDAVAQGKVLIAGIVYFDAIDDGDTFDFGATVYADKDGSSYYSGGVTLDDATGIKVGTYVGTSGVVGGVGVKVAVKIIPSQII